MGLCSFSWPARHCHPCARQILLLGQERCVTTVVRDTRAVCQEHWAAWIISLRAW